MIVGGTTNGAQTNKVLSTSHSCGKGGMVLQNGCWTIDNVVLSGVYRLFGGNSVFRPTVIEKRAWHSGGLTVVGERGGMRAS